MQTKRTVTTLVIFTLLFSLPSSIELAVAQAGPKNFSYSITLTVKYVNPNGGSRTWNLTEEDRTIGLFMNNAWQSVELKSTTFLLEAFKKDEDGNDIAVSEFPKQQLVPGENLSYTAEYTVVSKPRAIPNISEDASGTLSDIPQGLSENYTSAEGPWMTNDPTLAELAHNIGKNETNVLKLVKVFVAWIKENIQYATHEFPFYPNETLSAHAGDCDDQAILLIALSRIVGIPSHLQIGAIYMPQNVLDTQNLWEDHVRIVEKMVGWHGWAMLYVPPWGWLPADLTYITGGFSDPLDAIRNGAVTKQNTVQYLNISKTDYVAASRQDRAFLLDNGFAVELEDEMRETAPNSGGGLNPAVAIGFVLIVVMILGSSFLIARRWRRRPEDELEPQSEVVKQAQT